MSLIITAQITISLSKDLDSDQVLLFEAPTSGGTFSLVDTRTYKREEVLEYTSLIDDTKYYKIQFNNSVNSALSPLSNEMPGSHFDASAPFQIISDKFDGAGFALFSDVYTKTGLTTSYISQVRVEELLKEARAYIDVWMDRNALDRWQISFQSDVARRKYNASLELQKQAEVAYAAAKAYLHVGDTNLISMMENNETPFDQIKLGDLNIGQSNQAKSPDYLKAVQIISDRYYRDFLKYMYNMAPPSIVMEYGDEGGSGRRFRFPNEVN